MDALLPKRRNTSVSKIMFNQLKEQFEILSNYIDEKEKQHEAKIEAQNIELEQIKKELEKLRSAK